jgi:hypothetical protein
MKHITDITDITAMIGQLYVDEKCTHPMYSYDRAAYLFWQGFYEGLVKRGLSHEKALEEMQSKGVRWMFDRDANKVKNLGRKMAKEYTCYCPENQKY